MRGAREPTLQSDGTEGGMGLSDASALTLPVLRRDRAAGGCRVARPLSGPAALTPALCPQVFDLYTSETSLTTRWALYYGSLAHYVNIYLMDHTVFLLAYCLVVFASGNVGLHRIRLAGSAFSAPWLIQLGFFHVLPMLAEMKLEFSYLRFSDIFMSLPFFSHQNRITAAFFSNAIQTGSANYMGIVCTCQCGPGHFFGGQDFFLSSKNVEGNRRRLAGNRRRLEGNQRWLVGHRTPDTPAFVFHETSWRDPRPSLLPRPAPVQPAGTPGSTPTRIVIQPLCPPPPPKKHTQHPPDFHGLAMAA